MHHGCTHEQFEPGYDPRVTDEQAIAALVQLVQSGLTVDQAETRVGRPDGWARPALRGWAEAQGWGYAATADHLGLPRNTVKSWWQRARARQVLAGVVPASAPPRVVDFTPSPTPSSPSRGEKKPPPDLEVDAASMSREDFLAWLVRDIDRRLRDQTPRASGIQAQLIAQLRAARNELDELRTEARRGPSGWDDAMTDEEVIERMGELVPELPDVYLEVYVEAYLARHGLRVVERAAG